jgi:hypothetical protein
MELMFIIGCFSEDFDAIRYASGPDREVAEAALLEKSYRFEATSPGVFNLVPVEDRISRQPKPIKAPRKPAQGTSPTAAPKKIAIRLA